MPLNRLKPWNEPDCSFRVTRKLGGIILLILNVLILSGQSRNIVISGKVTDQKTGDPIPYVNILVEGTETGTTTDPSGKFRIQVNQAGKILRFSAIGFKMLLFPVPEVSKQDLEIKLNEESIDLQEITVRPDNNPAIRIFRKILDNKDVNNPYKMPSWNAKIYSKTEIDLKNIKPSLSSKKLLRSFDFVFNYIDTLQDGGFPFLPVFINETQSIFYHNQGAPDHEVIIANKASGMTSDMISQFTGKLYEGMNPYDNYLMISDIGLISPFNSLGLQFYFYYLQDSIITGNKKIYELWFRTKLPQEPTFKGKFWVEDSTFALTKVEMQLNKKANINFLHDLQYIVDYQKTEDKWLPKKEFLYADLDIQRSTNSKMIGILGYKNNYYSELTFAPVPKEISSQKNLITVQDGAMKKPDEYWDLNRTVPLQFRENQIYTMVDSIMNVPLYKTIAEYVYMFYYGYRDLGKVELGPYFYAFSYNEIEGYRFRLGARTTLKFDDKLRLNGYLAYGLRDREFKYSGGFDYFFSKKPANIITVRYDHDYELLGRSSNTFSEDNLLNSLLAKNPTTKLNLINKLEISYTREWDGGFSGQVNFKPSRIYSSPYVGFMNPLGKGIDHISSTELTIRTRYAPGEDIVQDGFERTTFGNYQNLLNLGITGGLKNFLGGQYNYLKLHFDISDKVLLNPIGYTTYFLQAEKIWGDVPFPLLKIHEGNETYAMDIYSFNLLNYHEFVSDTYVSLFLEHHFQGFFLNKIPLFRKLKWREIAGFRILEGYLSPDKHKILLFPEGMNPLTRTPYIETSAGIENILKVVRVDAVWRLNYHHPGTTRIGLLFSLQLIL